MEKYFSQHGEGYSKWSSAVWGIHLATEHIYWYICSFGGYWLSLWRPAVYGVLMAMLHGKEYANELSARELICIQCVMQNIHHRNFISTRWAVPNHNAGYAGWIPLKSGIDVKNIKINSRGFITGKGMILPVTEFRLETRIFSRFSLFYVFHLDKFTITGENKE